MLSLMQAAAATKTPPPHIVMVLTDDNGWAGVGYNNPHLTTPTLDALAKDGLILTSHYVYKYCAPTRGSFLTGRYPYKLAATRANLIPWTLPDGTHLDYAMLPKKLKANNYYSYHIGKWHQGLYTPEYTPVGRGFDQSFGFLEGGEDHNNSKTFGNFCHKGEVDLSFGRADASGSPYPHKWSTCTWQPLPGVALHNYYDPNSIDIPNYNPAIARGKNGSKIGSGVRVTEQECRSMCEDRIDCVGYSWRSQDPNQTHYHHCFLVKADGGEHKASKGFSSGSSSSQGVCSRSFLAKNATTLAATGRVGTYTGYLFSQEAERVVRQHQAATSPTTPMLMYLALHDTHAPLEAPAR